MSSYYNNPYTNNTPPPKIVVARVVAFLAIAVLATWATTRYLQNRQGMAVVAPQYMTSTNKDLDPMSFMERSWEPLGGCNKPLSTPTTLGSKYGLGGGPLVGSQSIRLGGSTFLPGQNITPLNDAQFQFRPPTGVNWSSPPTNPPPSDAPPMTNPLPGRRLMNDTQPGTQISWSTPPAPSMPPPTPAPLLPLIDDMEAVQSEMPPVMLSSAPLSRSKGKGSYFMGAPPAPNQIPQAMIVDTRDGKIIQPR
jgi:hypothetical protein